MVKGWIRGTALLLAVAFIAAPSWGQYNNNFGKNKVRYEKFDWEIYRGTHFDIWYYPEEEHLVEKVLSMAESAYDILSQEFDYQIQEPTPLVIYKTHSDFLQNNIIRNFIPEGVGAFATPNLFRMVMPIDLPDPELFALIKHELTHIFQYHVLFGSSFGRALTSAPPQWFMEGMASYMAEDETAADRMYLIDAVVNDLLPGITQEGVGGFFAYRYGHACFDFIEERWGKDGLRDFIYEIRNTLGARVGRAVERAFRITPEDFDLEFRRWLRQKYLPELVATGEPSDFGRPFRTKVSQSQEISPAASPSGDLVAAFTTYRGDIDIALFDTQQRTLLRNLTKGYTADFNNLIAQHLTTGRKMGRDLAFSPDGNQLVAFASKREAGRAMVLINVLKGGVRRVIDMEIEQQTSPSWSPDGRKIAFAGNTGGSFDIFLMDVETLEIENLTNDEIFDGAPSFSPDGGSIVFSSVIGDQSQLFVWNLGTGVRRQVMASDADDVDPIYSTDGERIYFTSDRDGQNNIYGVDLTSGEVRKYTNAVTGCFMPTVLPQPDGTDILVYTGYWRTRFDLYQTAVDEPIGDVQMADLMLTEPAAVEDLEIFQPDIQVTLDESNIENRKGFKLFLEDAGGGIGVDTDQTFLGQVYIQMGDFFGDRRLLGIFSSVSSFQNFDVIYTDLSRRNQRSLWLFDDRTFYRGEDFDPFTGRFERGDAAIKQTGLIASLTRPFNFNRRGSVGVGYILRDLDYQTFAPIDIENIPPDLDPDLAAEIVFDSQGNAFIPIVQPRSDDFPIVQASIVGDTAVFTPWGAVSGHRYRLEGDYAPDFDDTGDDSALQARLNLDVRQYLPVTRRSNFAFRFFGGVADGNFPQPYYLGSLDTIRGFDFRDLTGDRAFFTNIEFRFPLIDLLATPVFAFQGIRGRFFLDVGAVWYDDFEDFHFWDSDNDRLEDGVASYGFGITFRFFGLDLNWDFAKQWDFDTSGESETTFWIGQRF